MSFFADMIYAEAIYVHYLLLHLQNENLYKCE